VDAVFEVAGQAVETSASAGGPWDHAFQHGAAPAALVAWAAERLNTDPPMRIVRLTLDLVRPVPVAPLEIRSEVVRQGRKIQVASISLLARDVEVVRASVLKVLQASPPLPEGLGESALDVPLPDECEAISDEQRVSSTVARSPFLKGVSARPATRNGPRRAPAAIWFRANQPIVGGQPISPIMRAAIAADFGNGVSSVLDPKEWSFINGDVTLSLARPPVGEWILVNADMSLGRDGGGVAAARLGDVKGYFGRSAQSLVIERR
jgi:Acyl-CoA thioesterase C-terminal domain/Acyl-CoA thioesterase N-terminal domain